MKLRPFILDIYEVIGSYDLILFNHSLEHMTDPETATKEVRQHLAPGGVVLIHVPNIQNLVAGQGVWGYGLPESFGMGEMRQTTSKGALGYTMDTGTDSQNGNPGLS